MNAPYWRNKTLAIDGKDVEILAGETVLQLATRNRIFIPTLCYDPGLSPSGHCKVCLVEINGKIKAACITKAEDGMVVKTQSEKAREARKRRVTAILKQHKGDCATCPQYEFCGLLELADAVGLERPIFASTQKPHEEIIDKW